MNKNSVKNPLTVIAIFAGIAEISGTAVLPLLEKELQIVFVWFLMGFPTLLVSLFFYTLHKNHKSLYAPSDFKDDSSFISLIQDMTPEERKSNLKYISEEFSTPVTTTSGEVETSNTKIVGSLNRIESAGIVQVALSKLESETGITFDTGKKLQVGTPKRNIQIWGSGISHKDNKLAIAEVIPFNNTIRSDSNTANRLFSKLADAEEIYEHYKNLNNQEFKYILAVVKNGELSKSVETKIEKLFEKFTFPMEIKYYDMNDLMENENT